MLLKLSEEVLTRANRSLRKLRWTRAVACQLKRLVKHNIERLNLPYPEAVFEINFFRENPAPCTTHRFQHMQTYTDQCIV